MRKLGKENDTLSRHCEATKSPKQSITHAVRFWREFTLKNTNSYPKNATKSRGGLLRILRMLAMTNFGAWLCKFKAMSFNFRRFSTNTHPQTPSAREGALSCASRKGGLLRHSELVVRQAKNPHFKFTHFLQGVDSSLRYAPLRMTKFFAFAAFVAFLLTPQNLKAEQSGWFMGVQAGYGVGERQRQLETINKRITNIRNDKYVFADEFGNINTIQKEERLDGITGSWALVKDGSGNDGAGGDDKRNGSGNGLTNTYSIVQTYTFDPTDTNTYKTAISGTQLNNLKNYINRDTWTTGTTNEKNNGRGMVELNEGLKGVNAGLLAGYKHFFSTKFGLRVYGLLDYSYYKGSDSAALQKMQAYNANLNLDVLYNLVDKNDKIMGVFAGLSVGGAQYISSKTRLASDIDIGLNFGLRFGAGKHSIELFSRIGGLFVGAEHYGTSDTDYISENMWLNSTNKPTIKGIRVCPASEAGCVTTSDAVVGYEQGTGSAATAVDAQYRYRVFRYQYRSVYIKETSEAAAGSRMVDSYKQPYKIGIRYIYSF